MVAVWIAIGAALGFVVGKYLERKDWNALIEQGILPKPRRSHGKF